MRKLCIIISSHREHISPLARINRSAISPFPGYTPCVRVDEHRRPVVTRYVAVVYGGSAAGNLDPLYVFDSRIHPPSVRGYWTRVSSHLPARDLLPFPRARRRSTRVISRATQIIVRQTPHGRRRRNLLLTLFEPNVRTAARNASDGIPRVVRGQYRMGGVCREPIRSG